MVSILIINGPNLNLLGTRQPEVYGATTLQEVEALCVEQGASIGVDVTCFQSNHEGDLIDQIHAARGEFDGIILNAGAYSHTSIALMDAILSVEIPTIDLHLSNIHQREDFRHASYVAKAAVGAIVGFGPGGYLLAIDALMMHLDNDPGMPVPEDDDPDQEVATETTEDSSSFEDEMRRSVAQSDANQELPAEEHQPEAEEIEDVVEQEPEHTDVGRAANSRLPRADVSEIAAAAAAAIADQVRKSDAAKPAVQKEAATARRSGRKLPEVKKQNSAFNEVFDTPSKEVLKSLGISAPELTAPGRKEETPPPARSQGRSFRKLS